MRSHPSFFESSSAASSRSSGVATSSRSFRSAVFPEVTNGVSARFSYSEYPNAHVPPLYQPIPLKVVHPSVYATPPAVPAGVAPGKVGGGAVVDARRAR